MLPTCRVLVLLRTRLGVGLFLHRTPHSFGFLWPHKLRPMSEKEEVNNFFMTFYGAEVEAEAAAQSIAKTESQTETKTQMSSLTPPSWRPCNARNWF